MIAGWYIPHRGVFTNFRTRQFLGTDIEIQSNAKLRAIGMSAPLRRGVQLGATRQDGVLAATIDDLEVPITFAADPPRMHIGYPLLASLDHRSGPRRWAQAAAVGALIGVVIRAAAMENSSPTVTAVRRSPCSAANRSEGPWRAAMARQSDTKDVALVEDPITSSASCSSITPHGQCIVPVEGEAAPATCARGAPAAGPEVQSGERRQHGDAVSDHRRGGHKVNVGSGMAHRRRPRRQECRSGVGWTRSGTSDEQRRGRRRRGLGADVDPPTTASRSVGSMPRRM